MARQAIAEWKGDLKGGKGHVKFGSGAYEGDYTFTSRFEDKPGANPEEMIGAALGGCFSMALANTLAQLGFVANSIHTTADVHLGKDDKGFVITRVDLTCKGDVPNIDEAVAFYAKLFATEPNKRKPGYANFAIADPPLKLVLFEDAGAEARLNHLGVEVADSDAVWAHQQRLADDGVDSVEESGTCCFAKQDKVWVDGPDGSWEIYAVLEDSAPFHIHFSDIAFANRNETKHLPYGEGTLRAEPLADALARFERPATVISESPDEPSSKAIQAILAA